MVNFDRKKVSSMFISFTIVFLPEFCNQYSKSYKLSFLDKISVLLRAAVNISGDTISK